MTRHEAITIIGELPAELPGAELAQLQADLRELGDAMDARADAELLTLHDTERVHFMSFFVVEPEAGVGPGYAALEVNWDGPAAELYEHLSLHTRAALRRILGRCEGYPQQDRARDIVRYLKQHNRGADAYYLGTPDRSVKQIRTEATLRQRLRGELESLGWQNTAGRTFRALQQRFPQSNTPAPERSMAVRWSLRRGGFSSRVAAYRRAGVWVLAFLLAVLGLLDLTARVALELGAPPPLDPQDATRAWAWLGAQHTAQLLVGLVPAAYALLLALPWLRESPRHLSIAGRRLVWRALAPELFSWAWRSWLVAGLVGVMPRLLVLMHPLIADGVTLLGGALLVVAVGGFLYVTLGALVASLGVALAAFGWSQLIVDAPALLLLSGPVESCLMALLGVGGGGLYALASILVVHAVMHVAWGRLSGRLGPLLLGIIWLLLAWHFWQTPLRLMLYWSVVLLAVLLLLAVEAAIFLYGLRRLEEREAQGETRWDLAHLQRVQRREDLQFQNHLVNVSTIKGAPGSAEHRLRLLTLRGVLRAVSLAARVMFNRGDLGGINSIHFARFLILPDNRRLLFLSNYDDAFGAYLGDFTNVVGVTAVWGNTVGFPRPLFLLFAGIRDEQRFKAFGRRIQRETLGWYSAYPDLSVADVDAASALRAALSRDVSSAPVGAQPARIWRTSPMTEAECDGALRRI